MHKIPHAFGIGLQKAWQVRSLCEVALSEVASSCELESLPYITGIESHAPPCAQSEFSWCLDEVWSLGTSQCGCALDTSKNCRTMPGIDSAKQQMGRPTLSGGVGLVVAATWSCRIVDVRRVSCITILLLYSDLGSSPLFWSTDRVPYGVRPIRSCTSAHRRGSHASKLAPKPKLLVSRSANCTGGRARLQCTRRATPASR